MQAAIIDAVIDNGNLSNIFAKIKNLCERTESRLIKCEVNGVGKLFIYQLKQILENCAAIQDITTKGSKESRILSSAPMVQEKVLVPNGWQRIMPEFYKQITTFKRLFNANKYDDVPDALTAIIELEVIKRKPIIYVAS